MPISHASPVHDLQQWGGGLHRPECVVGTTAGDVFVSDWRGGVAVVRSDGSQEAWLARDAGFVLKPNGIAPLQDGSFLIANLGEEGGVWRLGRDGTLAPFLTEVDGTPLPPANFVSIDRAGRAWISVSTRHRPRQLAWRRDVADGFIVMVDGRTARIVADGLHYTNEVRVDGAGEWLYAVETFARRVRRFPVAGDGRLGAAETVVTLGHGCFPDGLAFDRDGGVWITSIVSNRLFRLRGDTLETLVEDVDAAYVDVVERAFAQGRMEASHLGPIPGATLQHLTSVAFAGPDGRTGVLGSLHGDCLYRFHLA